MTEERAPLYADPFYVRENGTGAVNEIATAVIVRGEMTEDEKRIEAEFAEVGRLITEHIRGAKR